jgi:uncharacterized protein (UPF0248 family)
MFELYNDKDELRRIPLHRVRHVTRNGQVIWRRALLHEHPQEPG